MSVFRLIIPVLNYVTDISQFGKIWKINFGWNKLFKPFKILHTKLNKK